MTNDQQAISYIKAIRNSVKHAYALRYYRFLLGTSKAEPDFDGLSYMAAQSVRMHLNGLISK